jgi:hypothetical protein
MSRPKKTKTLTDNEWLSSNPPQSEIELTPSGGYHIPIEKLRPLLDRINGTTRNYRTTFYKDGYSTICVCGSIELTVLIDGKERTVTGAYNLNITDAPNGFWNGTLKSECTKNAAYELGKRLGRDLNKDAPKPEPTPDAPPKEKGKPQPDSKIMEQFRKAVERGDQAAITTLTNIYEIKTESQ